MNNRLTELRHERGISQAELGSELGVSRQTIIAIESGKFEPRLSLAFRISELFGLSVEAIFRTGQDSNAPEVQGS